MRITNNMLVNNMINYIGRNLTRMDKYQYQLATGKKITVPSDDPVVAARALKLRTDVAEIEQYQRNVDDAMSWLDVTEGTLGKIGDVLQRARELAVQAANGTNTVDDTNKIKAEIEQLKSQLIHQANTTYAGRYIFSGYKTDRPLLDNTTGKFLLDVKNSEAINFEIGVGDDINVNVLGGDLFNRGADAVADTSGTCTGNAVVPDLTIPAGGVTLDLSIDGNTLSVNIPAGTYASSKAMAEDIEQRINTAISALPGSPKGITAEMDASGHLVFKTVSTGASSSITVTGGSNLNELGMTATTSVNGVTNPAPSMMQLFDDFISALENGDSDAISNMLSRFDNEISAVLRVRADVGARQNRLELTANRLENDYINFTKLKSNNEDIDMAETIMNLQNEENVYRASLAGGAKIIMPTLMDFLK